MGAKMGAPYGERHGKGKRYPDSMVIEVRNRFYDDGESVSAIAKDLGISEFTIRDWVAFKTRYNGTDPKPTHRRINL